MPKRKAPTKLSGLTGSDDEDIMQLTENEAPPQNSQDEPPSKKRRGRPRTSNDNAAETKTTAQAKKRESSLTAQAEAPVAKKTGRRGRPRGSSRTSEAPETQPAAQEPPAEENFDQENEDPMEEKETKPARATRGAKTAPAKAAPAKAAPARRGGRATSAAKQVLKDGEFEYTPTGAKKPTLQNQPAEEPEASPQPRAVQRRHVTDGAADESDEESDEEPAIEESILPEEAPAARAAQSSTARNARARLSSMRNTQEPSPRKRKSGSDADQGNEPELRRKVGDLTKKNEALESKLRNLREIGIVEANTNMEKLRKQVDTVSSGTIRLNPMSIS